MGHMDPIRDFDFHPGEPHIRVFSYNRSSVLRWDDLVFVSESSYGDVVFRHYAFPDEWFKINVTTDRAGHIVETPPFGDIPAFAFNCDIATPMVQDRNAIHAVDLCADVLVRKNGVTFEIVDEAELGAAVAAGLISSREYRHGSRGLARLIDLIRGNELVPFLHEMCPFGDSSAEPALPATTVPVSRVPLLQARLRATW